MPPLQLDQNSNLGLGFSLGNVSELFSLSREKMGKKEKKPKRALPDDEGDAVAGEKPTPAKLIILSDDEDEEANADLSLKIVQKAMALRACSTTSAAALNGAALDERKAGVFSSKDAVSSELRMVGDDGEGLSPREKAEFVMNLKESKKKKKENKSKKAKAIEAQPQEATGDVIKAEEKSETGQAAVIDELIEENPVNVEDNVVLRKLLRGPRYFDPPDSGWGTCHNCGEEGHSTVNCTSARRKKPCFICGSLDHHGRQCVKGQDCFICKGGGHRAKDCPEKYKGGSMICLKCGETGHDLFSCKNDYNPGDLKEIQCYICKNFGHLCCAEFTNAGPREYSCYRCGQSGHTGLACSGSHREASGTASSFRCYKCGEEGHFLRECTSSAKVGKRNRELSTPNKGLLKKAREDREVKSVPHDFGKARKRRKDQYKEGRFSGPSKSKQRGGWITEDPGDFPCRKARAHGWESPATPYSRGRRIFNLNDGGYASNSHSPSKGRKLFGNSASNGYQDRFSASRFGNTRRDRTWDNNGW